MKLLFLTIVLLLSFTVTPFAQPTTKLETALENALQDCRNDYIKLSKNYHSLDSTLQKSIVKLRYELNAAEAATEEAELQRKEAERQQAKRSRKTNILYGTFGGVIGIIAGLII